MSTSLHSMDFLSSFPTLTHQSSNTMPYDIYIYISIQKTWQSIMPMLISGVDPVFFKVRHISRKRNMHYIYRPMWNWTILCWKRYIFSYKKRGVCHLQSPWISHWIGDLKKNSYNSFLHIHEKVIQVDWNLLLATGLQFLGWH